MYIPRPAKLLFTVDDGWNRYLEKHGDSVSQWTPLAVERMRACGTCAMGVRRYCCASPDCTHSRFFCQSCKSKACSAGGMKSTEQWIAEQQHVLPDCKGQHITFTMPHLLWSFFSNNWPLLNNLFRCATRALLRHARKLGIEVGIFCALHTYGRQLNQPPHIHVSVTRGSLDVMHGVWRRLFFKKKAVEEIWQSAVIRLLSKVYEALEMMLRKKPEKPGFAVLIKGFLGTDPYQCILCKGRLRFAGAQAGTQAMKLLSERLRGMEKKRCLRMPELDQYA